MTDPTTSLTAHELVDLAKKHKKTLFFSALIGALLALGSTLLTERQWDAYQGLLIRGEAAGFADQRLGKFTDLSEMKTVQETLLELAKSQSVVSAVLAEVGKPKKPNGTQLVFGLVRAKRLAKPRSGGRLPKPVGFLTTWWC